jgi:hypothetical protein
MAAVPKPRVERSEHARQGEAMRHQPTNEDAESKKGQSTTTGET